jgi:DNA-binding transcriptional LysR family regulator
LNNWSVEAFLSVASTQSISKAAEQLYLSQPAVSHRIKSLEKELNVCLIERGKGGKNTRLTPIGEQFIPIAQRWMSLWKASQQLQHSSEQLFLNIGCMDSLNIYAFMPLYKKMINGPMPIHLHIETHQGAEIPALLENHIIDLGFAFSPYGSKSTFSHPIFSEDIYLICPTGSRPPDKIIHPSELNPTDELYLKWSNDHQRWHDYWWDPAIMPHAQVDTASLILHMMDSERFWATVPFSVAKAFCESGNVQLHTLSEPPPPRICYKLLHRYPNPSRERSLEIFNAMLDEYITDDPWLT